MSEPINRLDPQWGMFAAAYVSGPWHPEMAVSPHDQYKPSEVADFADAMIRERDRRCADEGLLAHIEGMPDKTCNCDELREAAMDVLDVVDAFYLGPTSVKKIERLRNALGEQA